MANYTIADLSEKTNIINCYVELDDNSPRENKSYGFKTIVGSGDGLATLQNGKLHPSQTPEIRVASPTVVSSQAQMLALDAVVGSVAIRTDTNENFILSSLPASTLENWIVLNDKLGVTSVFGRSTSAITAQSGDYTTDFVPEGSDPLRKYYTKARFDFDFANSIELIKNEPGGILALDNDKKVQAADFTLIDPTQSLKAIYDNANQPEWFVKLNSAGKIDPDYLPDATFSTLGINSTSRRARVQINPYPASMPDLSFLYSTPMSIGAPSPNWASGSLTAAQDVLTYTLSGVGGASFGNIVRQKIQAYAWGPKSSPRTSLGFYLSDNIQDEYNGTPEQFRMCSEGAIVMKVIPSAPSNACLFNNSLTFYTDTAQGNYIGRIKKSNGTVTDANPMFKLSSTVPGVVSAGNGSMAFYSPTSNHGRYVAMVNAGGSLAGSSPVVIASAGGASDADMKTLPYGSLDFFYTNEITTVGAKIGRSTSASIVDFLIRAATAAPDMMNTYAGQVKLYIQPDGANYALYAKVKSPDGVMPDTTFKLATSM